MNLSYANMLILHLHRRNVPALLGERRQSLSALWLRCTDMQWVQQDMSPTHRQNCSCRSSCRTFPLCSWLCICKVCRLSIDAFCQNWRPRWW